MAARKGFWRRRAAVTSGEIEPIRVGDVLPAAPGENAQQVAGRDDWQRQQAITYQAYNALLRDLSLELGADLVDVSSPLQAAAPALVLQDDGLHLTIAGQAIVAAVVSGRIIGPAVGQEGKMDE